MSRPRVRYVTIFVFPSPGKGKPPVVTTTPQRLTARPGDVIDWTVVNAAGSGTKVTVAFPKGSPLKGRSTKPFDRWVRDDVRAKVEDGLYKYDVLVDGKVAFDPEIEIMR